MPGKKNEPLYEALEKYAKGARSYLEIGVREGHSLKVVLEHADIELLVLCDNWGGSFGGTNRGNHNHILPLVEGISSVIIWDGNSQECIPKSPLANFDLVLVDGDHSFLGALADLENCWIKLAIGGYMIIDDLSHPKHLYIEPLCHAFNLEHDDCELVEKETERGYGVCVFKKTPLEAKE